MSSPGTYKRCFLLSAWALLVWPEGEALACGTCSLDSASSGQILMLVGMLSLPLVIGALGYGIIRRLLAKAELL